MNRSLADLLRDIRNHGAEISYQNNRGTTDGRPCIWRQRFVEVWVGHAWITFIYGNWPPTNTYQIRSHVHDDLSIDPVASVAELWEAWERHKAAASVPRERPSVPEPVGQLDLLDLLAGAR